MIEKIASINAPQTGYCHNIIRKSDKRPQNLEKERKMIEKNFENERKKVQPIYKINKKEIGNYIDIKG